MDTNVIIYYLKGDAKVVETVRKIFSMNSPVYVSTITEIELFGFHNLTDSEAADINEFLHIVSVIPVDSRIARLAGAVRKNHHLKLPDSAIAATTLFTGTRLLTRNVNDFKGIPNLQVQGI